MSAKFYEGYRSFDHRQHDWWARFFCAEMPDGTCGMILVQQHFIGDFPFDKATEANIGIVTGGSPENAMTTIAMGTVNQVKYPAVIRRLSRLLTHGSLTESIKDTLSERGLERAVVYSDHGLNLEMFERAGFKYELRDDVPFYTLDL